MSPVFPAIDPRIAEIAPGFRALSISVVAAPITNPDVATEALHNACKSVSAGAPPWGESHLAAWAEAFRRFGAKPQRTPCSAEALRKRVARDGGLPSIDPVVDLYNAISIGFAIPVGGENYEAYVGSPRLTIADGTELFDTIKEGLPANEAPEKGEVVWRDDHGVTCRRWNWRQGVRTRLDANAQHMWFILESLPEMPLEAVQAAGDALISGVLQMMPGATINQQIVEVDY
jgi:DNA/RNA-binding domain of Phe-tRNA-synthetase-like protein